MLIKSLMCRITEANSSCACIFLMAISWDYKLIIMYLLFISRKQALLSWIILSRENKRSYSLITYNVQKSGVQCQHAWMASWQLQQLIEAKIVRSRTIHYSSTNTSDCTSIKVWHRRKLHNVCLLMIKFRSVIVF